MLRAGGSELALVSKLKTLHEDNQRFFVPDKFSSNKFGVKHYAEPVSYTVDGWCERNRDALHNDLVRLMKKSAVSSSRVLRPSSRLNVYIEPEMSITNRIATLRCAAPVLTGRGPRCL